MRIMRNFFLASRAEVVVESRSDGIKIMRKNVFENYTRIVRLNMAFLFASRKVEIRGTLTKTIIFNIIPSVSTYSSLVLGDMSELISLEGRIVGPDLCESFSPRVTFPLFTFDFGSSELFVRRFRKSVLSAPAV